MFFTQYQVLMAEGILTLYSANTWTRMTTKKTKTTLHWLMQVAGSALAITGNVIEIRAKEQNHFVSIHAKLGLVSFVFLVVSMLNGVLSLFSVDLKRFVKPVYNKLFHSTMSVVCFVTGMVSLIYGYETGFIQRSLLKSESTHHAVWLEAGTGLTILLSLPGVCKTMYNQVKGLIS